MELKEQLKESEVTKTSVELQKQGSVVDEVLAGTKEADCLNPLVSNLNKMLEEEDINLFDRMLANYLLDVPCLKLRLLLTNLFYWKSFFLLFFLFG